MPEVLSFAIQQREGAHAVIQVSGSMDFDTCPPLELALAELVNTCARHLVLDMGGVLFCDSSGVNALLQVRAHVGEHGSLALAAAQPQVRRPLELIGVDALIPLHPSVAAALENLPT